MQFTVISILLATSLTLVAAAPATTSPPPALVDLEHVEPRGDCLNPNKYRKPCHPKCKVEAKDLDYCHCLDWCSGTYQEQGYQRLYDNCCKANHGRRNTGE
ncbi:Nn.00g097250.m01.CDS01 [Neocucurbitaria sp. VM-36]